MSISLRKPRWLGKGALALAAGAAFLASVSTPARAVMLPGSALFGYYDVSPPTRSGEFGFGSGDSILTLVNPNGNANISFGAVLDSCAMIYVFDENQEMGECCGCPLSPTKEESFSVEHNLTSNWAVSNPTGVNTHQGVIAIRAVGQPNAIGCNSFSVPGTINPACNGGCDPTNGFTATPTLLGSIIHVQDIDGTEDETEVSLFDNGTGDTAQNNPYLIQQCAAIVGNGTGGGICTCPSTIESISE